jgi:hypothetical protein
LETFDVILSRIPSTFEAVQIAFHLSVTYPDGSVRFSGRVTERLSDQESEKMTRRQSIAVVMQHAGR